MTIFSAFANGRESEGKRSMNEQSPAMFEVRSEARGPHWVAWLSEPGQKSPHQSILLVGATREEAETRARDWGAKLSAQRVTSSPSS
jgi:hypothetical protein